MIVVIYDMIRVTKSVFLVHMIYNNFQTDILQMLSSYFGQKYPYSTVQFIQPHLSTDRKVKYFLTKFLLSWTGIFVFKEKARITTACVQK